MIARCSETSALGVCVSSASLAVGSVVPHVESRVGAIAVQGYTNFLHGVNGLRLLRDNFSPKDVLEILLKNDSRRDMRQISIINVIGEKAVFTGRKTLEWSGHIIGENYIAAGNALISENVLESMAEAFESSKGEWLAERLMRALEAGEKAGGDWRGIRSAAIKVAEREIIHESRPIIDLRVDFHDKPIRELRKVFEAYKSWLQLF